MNYLYKIIRKEWVHLLPMHSIISFPNSLVEILYIGMYKGKGWLLGNILLRWYKNIVEHHHPNWTKVLRSHCASMNLFMVLSFSTGCNKCTNSHEVMKTNQPDKQAIINPS